MNYLVQIQQHADSADEASFRPLQDGWRCLEIVVSFEDYAAIKAESQSIEPIVGFMSGREEENIFWVLLKCCGKHCKDIHVAFSVPTGAAVH